MNLPRRKLLHLAAGAVAAPVVLRPACADTYPSRPVHLIIGYLPGGSADMTARLFGQWLSERLNQQFVVESRSGGSTNIATEAVIRAAPDGYTLLLASPANATNASLYEKLNFEFLREVEPVAGLIRFADVVIVNPSLAVKTIPELIAYAKANPGVLNFASSGVGSTLHVAGELFKMMTGVNIVNVPYRDGAPAMLDLIAGRAQVMFDNVPTALPHIREGKIRPLGGACRCAARSAARRRLRAGLRGERLVRHCCAERRPRRHRRQAQPRGQRHPGRARSENSARRAWRIASSRHSSRFRQAARRQDREVA